MMKVSRRTVLAMGAITAASLPAAMRAKTADKTLRVAFQKGNGSLLFLRKRGTLKKRLAPLGWSVEWTEFSAGPQLLEALNIGAADFGRVGEAPPIFAQAAGANIVYAGYKPGSPKNEAIIVPGNSPIKTVKDLKGKRVALNKGSNVHYLLVRALESNGLAYEDISPAYLTPADARAAFERGSIDAWVIWDPYYAAAELQLKARPVVDATGLASNVSYYMATRPFAEKSPEALQAVISSINEIEGWIEANQKQYAEELSAQIGLPSEVVARWVTRDRFGARPIDAPTLTEQQAIADTFTRLKLLPKSLRVRDAALSVGL
jgi:sulfonate transport system substrate-binding protein